METAFQTEVCAQNPRCENWCKVGDQGALGKSHGGLRCGALHARSGPYMLGQRDDPIPAEIGLWELMEDGDTGVVANNRTAGRLGDWPAGVQMRM